MLFEKGDRPEIENYRSISLITDAKTFLQSNNEPYWLEQKKMYGQ